VAPAAGTDTAAESATTTGSAVLDVEHPLTVSAATAVVTKPILTSFITRAVLTLQLSGLFIPKMVAQGFTQPKPLGHTALT
jgi:hypothetical protein